MCLITEPIKKHTVLIKGLATNKQIINVLTKDFFLQLFKLSGRTGTL